MSVCPATFSPAPRGARACAGPLQKLSRTGGRPIPGSSWRPGLDQYATTSCDAESCTSSTGCPWSIHRGARARRLGQRRLRTERSVRPTVARAIAAVAPSTAPAVRDARSLVRSPKVGMPATARARSSVNLAVLAELGIRAEHALALEHGSSDPCQPRLGVVQERPPAISRDRLRSMGRQRGRNAWTSTPRLS